MEYEWAPCSLEGQNYSGKVNDILFKVSFAIMDKFHRIEGVIYSVYSFFKILIFTFK